MVDNLTVIVPYRNGGEMLSRLLASLPNDLPIIVVDDASDPSLVDSGRAVVARRGHRGYFAGAVNSGIRACKTDVLILNQDVELEGDRWLDLLADHRGEYALIGDGVFGHPAWPRGYVQGTFMYMHRDAINAVGLLNEQDWPLWGATCEWQVRACRKGFKALPLREVPGLKHNRRRGQRFGMAIERALREEPDKRDWFIRTPPMISVVVPCFNYGRYLRDCINSLIGGETSMGAHPGQTYHGFEVIIVDDASTDDTEELARSLADDWKAVRYIRHEANRGCPAAENTGIRAAHGRYVQIISADDMAGPELLEARLRVLEKSPRAVAYSDIRLFGGGKWLGEWKAQEYDFDKLLYRNHVPCGIMVARQGLLEIGGVPENFRWGREDWAVAVALGRAGYCGVRVPGATYWYRREGQSRTLRNSSQEWMAFFRQQMLETFPDLYGGGNKPMGCCGKRNTVPRLSVAATGAGPAMMVPRPLPGTEGMVLVEYVGKNLGRTFWYGPTTNTRYMFSGRERVKYVDARDVDGLLSMRMDREPAFRLYKAPTPAMPVGDALVERALPVDEQCAAITKSGARCKRKALLGSRFCAVHSR